MPVDVQGFKTNHRAFHMSSNYASAVTTYKDSNVDARNARSPFEFTGKAENTANKRIHGYRGSITLTTILGSVIRSILGGEKKKRVGKGRKGWKNEEKGRKRRDAGLIGHCGDESSQLCVSVLIMGHMILVGPGWALLKEETGHCYDIVLQISFVYNPFISENTVFHGEKHCVLRARKGQKGFKHGGGCPHNGTATHTMSHCQIKLLQNLHSLDYTRLLHQSEVASGSVTEIRSKRTGRLTGGKPDDLGKRKGSFDSSSIPVANTHRDMSSSEPGHYEWI
eukprot:gene19775-biopygen816